MARTSKWSYVTDNLELISKLASEGVYEKEIARAIRISPKTWFEYKANPRRGPVLKEALSKGRRVLITDLKKSLYERARGFEKEEIKVTMEELPDGSSKKKVEKTTRYFPPDTGALVFALTNLTQRDGDIFYNRQDIEHGGKIDVEIVIGED